MAQASTSPLTRGSKTASMTTPPRVTSAKAPSTSSARASASSPSIVHAPNDLLYVSSISAGSVYRIGPADTVGGASPAPSQTAAASSAPTGATVEVTVGTDTGAELKFEPGEVNVPTGADVRLTFENRSTVPHNLTFQGPITSPRQRSWRREPRRLWSSSHRIRASTRSCAPCIRGWVGHSWSGPGSRDRHLDRQAQRSNFRYD